MGKRLLSICCQLLVLVGLHLAAHGQGIVATYTSDGRLVYENAPEKPAVPSGLRDKRFYWSNTENRWKAIPPSYSQSMRAANSAANDVRRLLRQAARGDSRFWAVGNALLTAKEQGPASGNTLASGSAAPGGA